MAKQERHLKGLSVTKDNPTWKLQIIEDGHPKALDVDQTMIDAAQILFKLSQKKRSSIPLHKTIEKPVRESSQELTLQTISDGRESEQHCLLEPSNATEVKVVQNGKAKLIDVDPAMMEAALIMLDFSKLERLSYPLKEIYEPSEIIGEAQLEENDPSPYTTMKIVDKRLSKLLGGIHVETAERPYPELSEYDKENMSVYPSPPPSCTPYSQANVSPKTLVSIRSQKGRGNINEKSDSPVQSNEKVGTKSKKNKKNKNKCSVQETRAVKLSEGPGVTDNGAEEECNKKSVRKKYYINVARYHPEDDSHITIPQNLKDGDTEAVDYWLARANELEDKLFEEVDVLNRQVAEIHRNIASYTTYANFLRGICNLKRCRLEIVEDTAKEDYSFRLIWEGESSKGALKPSEENNQFSEKSAKKYVAEMKKEGTTDIRKKPEEKGEKLSKQRHPIVSEKMKLKKGKKR